MTPEWRETSFEILFNALPLVGLSLIATSFALLGLVLPRRPWPVLEALLLLALSAVGLRAIRFVPEFLIATALPVAALFDRLLSSPPHARLARVLPFALGAGLGISHVAEVATDGMPRLAFRARRAWFPHAAARALEGGPSGELCNSFEFGRYLLERLAPRLQPYIDGRIASVYPVSMLADWMAAEADPERFERLAEAREFVACVVAYPDPYRVRHFPRDDLARAEALTDDRFLLSMLRARIARIRRAPDGESLAAEALARFPGRESLRFADLDPHMFLEMEVSPAPSLETRVNGAP